MSGEGDWPEHDAHLPLMSLPHVLGLGATAVTPRAPYLKSDPARTQAWSAAIGRSGSAALRIGLVHATSAAHSTEENPFTRRSCRPNEWMPVLRHPGIEAFNLNLAGAAEEAQRTLPELRALPEPLQDFDDTAAVVGLLDAVVSVDTAAAHVAGALGVPLLLLLPEAADWKWQPHAAVPPWYQAIRTVRKNGTQEWQSGVLSRLEKPPFRPEAAACDAP